MLLAARVRGAEPGAPARGRALVDRLGLRDVAELAPAPALRRRAAALRDRARAGQRPVAAARRRADRQPRRRGRRRACSRCCASWPPRAARSCSSRTSASAAGDRRPRAAARARPAGAAREPARAPRLARAALGVFAAVARGRDRRDRRLRAGDRLRPRGERGRPPRRDRALRPRAARDRRRARARAAQPRGALLPARGARTSACARTGTRPARASLHIVLGGRRGYAVIEGRDLARRTSEVVVERGLAREWDLAPGDRHARSAAAGTCGSSASRSRPTTSPSRSRLTPRVYASERATGTRRVHGQPGAALARRPRARRHHARAGARDAPSGIGGLSFVTRAGIEVLLDQAAGIVIALLVAFSLVALAAAGTMLAAGAHADVQRRLPAFGVQRALGFTPARLAAAQARRGGAGRRARGRARARPRARSRPRGPSRGAARAAQRAAAGRGAAARARLAAWLGDRGAGHRRGDWPAWRAARRAAGRAPARRRPRAARAPGPRAAPRRRRAGAGLRATGARFALAARGAVRRVRRDDRRLRAASCR